MNTKFLDLFAFKKNLTGYMGVERERFLIDSSGMFVPRAYDFLREIHDPLWTYELSACQVEDRTPPERTLTRIWRSLYANDQNANRIARRLGVRIVSQEVAPFDMPLDIYPDERYREIRKRITEEQLRAACRVAGVHFHFGMKDMRHAIRSYNVFRKYLSFLVYIGDGSFGERQRIYKTMAHDWDPPEIIDAAHFSEVADARGFLRSPRSCYWLIRISVHGTVELRMFGAAKSRLTIVRNLALARFLLRRAGEA